MLDLRQGIIHEIVVTRWFHLKEFGGNPGDIAGFPGAAHSACIFRTEEERFKAVVPFILAGLSRGDKCVYILDDTSEDDVVDAMMRARDVQRHADEGDITFLRRDEAYLRDGCFNADRMLGFIRQGEQKALADGYAGLTATGEMSWQKTDAPGTDQLMEYEARLNDLYPESNPTLLCQYEEPVFDHTTLLDAIRTHPRVVLNGELCVNPYYTPPDEFLSMRKGVIPRETYERTRLDILKRARFSMIHRMEMRDFRRARRRLSTLESFGLCDIQPLIEVVGFYNDLVRDSCSDPTTLSYLEVIARKCGDVQKRTRFMKAYQSVGESELRWHGLESILDSVCTGIDCGVVVRESEVEGVEILADGLFGGAIRALVENMPDLRNSSDEVRVRTHRSEDDLVVSIEHVDGGVPDRIKDVMFEFAHRYGQSDGFGLFLAAEILSSSGMSVRENGIAGRCTMFEIRIPAGKHRVASR
ncbi:MAG: MEDS domain-containing protein [Anaerolineales bacterium]|nr:MEDS domain-containing protein [Anaerolineales bacterium]